MENLWQKKSWPDFKWDSERLLKPLGVVRFNQENLMAQVRELGFDSQQAARADVLVEDALKISAIEGEILNPDAVLSSVGRQLGINDAEPEGFEGGLKNKKYMDMTHTSCATAQRELADFLQKGILIKLPGGG